MRVCARWPKSSVTVPRSTRRFHWLNVTLAASMSRSAVLVACADAASTATEGLSVETSSRSLTAAHMPPTVPGSCDPLTPRLLLALSAAPLTTCRSSTRAFWYSCGRYLDDGRTTAVTSTRPAMPPWRPGGFSRAEKRSLMPLVKALVASLDDSVPSPPCTANMIFSGPAFLPSDLPPPPAPLLPRTSSLTTLSSSDDTDDGSPPPSTTSLCHTGSTHTPHRGHASAIICPVVSLSSSSVSAGRLANVDTSSTTAVLPISGAPDSDALGAVGRNLEASRSDPHSWLRKARFRRPPGPMAAMTGRLPSLVS
mmetsp:Transcript_2357/g.6279  ORF Transcript_2357/g.6279 Transcript_2357/m.6279 type:complete len:310 (-) Transcript_2357:354-1283(-)